MNIHEAQKTAIKKWAYGPEENGLLVLCGQRGVGKTAACLNALESNVSCISIYENEFFQFQELLDSFSTSPCGNNDVEGKSFYLGSYIARIICKISTLLEDNQFLLIENMNFCDGEHRRILGQVQAYCQVNNTKCNIILSFNDSPSRIKKYQEEYGACACVAFEALDMETVSKFARLSLSADVDEKTSAAVSDKIASIASGLIGCVPLIYEALEKSQIFVKKKSGYALSPGIRIEMLPNNITEMYELQMKLLTERERQLLLYALPFGRDIHLNLLGHILHDKCLDDAYSNIVDTSILIVKNRLSRQDALFDKSFRLSSDRVQNAIESTSSKEAIGAFQRKVRNALFPRRGKCGEFVSSDDYIDQYELLRYLSGISSGSIIQTSKEVVIDLMGILFLGGYYVRVCDVAQSYFLGFEERYRFTATHAPLILDLYLESLYLMGNYEQVIAISEKYMPHSRSALVCARAYYAIDNLEESRRWANIAAAEKETRGEAHLLLSSIADWEDDDRESRIEFALAMKALGKPRIDVSSNSIAKRLEERNRYYAQLVLRRDYLRYLPKKTTQLSKEVKAFCQQLIASSGDRLQLSRIQAEILHNHGTDLIKSASTRKAGLECLEAADGYFKMKCDKDRYCVRNSIAIASCLDEDFDSGLKIFERLQPPPHAPFCVLAVRNNEIATLIALGERHLAKEKCKCLFNYIKQIAVSEGLSTDGRTECDILLDLSQVRNDMKRQLKHYCLNRAKIDSDNGLDIGWIKMANKISKAESSSNYLVEKCLYAYREQIRANPLRHKVHKPRKPASDSIDYWFSVHEIFLCEVMFWG